MTRTVFLEAALQVRTAQPNVTRLLLPPRKPHTQHTSSLRYVNHSRCAPSLALLEGLTFSLVRGDGSGTAPQPPGLLTPQIGVLTDARRWHAEDVLNARSAARNADSAIRNLDRHRWKSSCRVHH